MSRKKKPRISAEDEALWRLVTATAAPMAKARRKSVVIQEPSKKPCKPVPEPKPNTLPSFKLGEKLKAKSQSTPPPSSVPLNMDHKSFTRMKRGKLRPEGRIDLHGMTLSQAHPKLTGFILRAHAKGLRLVLVITGKGRSGRDDGGPIPSPPGVLRRQVPQWLQAPPLGAVVLQTSQAHQSHGGDGAYYVYLRRAR